MKNMPFSDYLDRLINQTNKIVLLVSDCLESANKLPILQTERITARNEVMCLTDMTQKHLSVKVNVVIQRF